jgi:hypothetical protein
MSAGISDFRKRIAVFGGANQDPQNAQTAKATQKLRFVDEQSGY